MEELKNALESVPDCYDDFVKGTIIIIKKRKELAEKVIEFIKENPDAKTDDVIEYLDSLRFSSHKL